MFKVLKQFYLFYAFFLSQGMKYICVLILDSFSINILFSWSKSTYALLLVSNMPFVLFYSPYSCASHLFSDSSPVKPLFVSIQFSKQACKHFIVCLSGHTSWQYSNTGIHASDLPWDVVYTTWLVPYIVHYFMPNLVIQHRAFNNWHRSHLNEVSISCSLVNCVFVCTPMSFPINSSLYVSKLHAMKYSRAKTIQAIKSKIPARTRGPMNWVTSMGRKVPVSAAARSDGQGGPTMFLNQKSADRWKAPVSTTSLISWFIGSSKKEFFGQAKATVLALLKVSGRRIKFLQSRASYVSWTVRSEITAHWLSPVEFFTQAMASRPFSGRS